MLTVGGTEFGLLSFAFKSLDSRKKHLSQSEQEKQARHSGGAECGCLAGEEKRSR